MRSPIIAVLLALSTAAASAQCVAQAPAEMSVVPPVVSVAAAPRGGELIATATAAPSNFQSPVHANARSKPSHGIFGGDDKGDRHTGAAMLFAAVALMSGIALRRYSAPGP